MIRSVVVLVVGLVLFVVGLQGAIRIVVDHDNAGLLGSLPGGFVAQLVTYIVAVVVGAALAARANPRVPRSDD